MVGEVWDDNESRWQMVDLQWATKTENEVNGKADDWLDLTEDEFLTGTMAWKAASAGKVEPDRFMVASKLKVPSCACGRTSRIMWCTTWRLFLRQRFPRRTSEASRRCPWKDLSPKMFGLDESSAVTSQPNPELYMIEKPAPADDLLDLKTAKQLIARRQRQPLSLFILTQAPFVDRR